MLNFLYQVIIYPFEFALGQILNLIYGYTQGYGLAIVLLSVAVNTLLLPFYRLAEQWQAEERAKQSLMASKLAEIKSVYKGYERHALTSTLYRQHSYNPLYSLKSVVGLLIQIPFFLAAYNLLLDRPDLSGESFLFVADLAKPDSVISTSLGSLNVLPFIMTFVNVVAIRFFSQGTSFKENRNQYLLAAVFFVALYTASSALLIYWTTSNIYGLLKPLLLRKTSRSSAANTQFDSNNRVSEHAKKLYWYGLFLILSLPLVFIPSALLASGSSADFSEPWSFYIQPLFGALVGGLFIGFIICSALPKAILNLVSLVFAALSLCMLVNTFAFNGDYGDMSNFIFEAGLEIDNRDYNINYLALLLMFAGTVCLAIVGKSALLVKFLQASILACIGLAVTDTYSFFNKREGIEKPAEQNDTNVFRFSKTEKNVVVMMMDRMVGGYVPHALESVRGLEEKLEGFTWYPKTLSPGAFTILGVPTIAGGYDYLPARINNLDDSVPLALRLDQSLRVLPYNFENAGFNTAMISPSSFIIANNTQHIENTKITWLTDFYHYFWRKRLGLGSTASSDHSRLMHFGLFRAAPLSLREKIYTKGTWEPFKKSSEAKDIEASLKEQKIWDRSTYYGGIKSPRNATAIKHWAVMDDLSLMSSVDESLPSQYYYFTNELNHEPWITRPDLGIELDGPVTYSPALIKKFGSKYSTQHAVTVAATMKHLLEWIEWMKVNDVYHNTRLIVVSDHGRNVRDPMFEKQGLTRDGVIGRDWAQVGYFHSALLVKDFESKKPFKVSDKFMTTADVPWLALEGIQEGVNPFTNGKIREPNKKTPWSVAYTPWRLNEQHEFKFKIHEHFIVENEDIFNTGNWRKAPVGSQLPAPTIEYAENE